MLSHCWCLQVFIIDEFNDISEHMLHGIIKNLGVCVPEFPIRDYGHIIVMNTLLTILSRLNEWLIIQFFRLFKQKPNLVLEQAQLKHYL